MALHLPQGLYLPEVADAVSYQQHDEHVQRNDKIVDHCQVVPQWEKRRQVGFLRIIGNVGQRELSTDWHGRPVVNAHLFFVCCNMQA